MRINSYHQQNVVTSAYVCGEDAGLIMEQPYHMGMAKRGDDKVDINFEKKMVQDKLNQLVLEDVPEKEITSAMKDLGIERYLFFLFLRSYAWLVYMARFN